jgi:hypothetical protein
MKKRKVSKAKLHWDGDTLKSATIAGKTYDVEKTMHGWIIREEVVAWDGPSVVLVGPGGDEFNAPIVH